MIAKRTYRVTFTNYKHIRVEATSMNGAVRVAAKTSGQHSSRIRKVELVETKA